MKRKKTPENAWKHSETLGNARKLSETPENVVPSQRESAIQLNRFNLKLKEKF